MVIVSLDQVTPVWLTSVLQRSGALVSGSVVGFAVAANQRLLSDNAKLNLQYSDDARGDLPPKLFLKMVDTDQDDEFFGSSEVDYYIRDYIGVPDVPLPRCYDAAYSETLGRYHVLLDDLSATHAEARTKIPTLDYGLALAEGFAAMHAHWWGAEKNAPIPSADAINRFVGIAQPGSEHILAAVADQLEPHWPAAIRELFVKHPPLLIERTQNPSGFTLIHGDANWNNILVPIAADRPIYILDRQPFDWSLTTWLGVYDLAYAMILDWDIDVRRQLEQLVLQHYHQQLIQRGIRDYAWEQLWDDYRLMAAMTVYIPIEWCRGQFNADTLPTWMPMLQNAMTAFDDLACAKLWSA